MEVQIVKISKLKTNPNNPRLIKDGKYKSLVKSITDFPKMLELRPIVVDKDFVVLGGNMRLKACQEAGLKEVPIVIADELTEKEQREFIIKDNVSFGEWDWEILLNEWDTDDLIEWGLNMPILNADDINLQDFFEENNLAKEQMNKIVLEYTEEECEKVKLELLKHGKTPEDAVYKLLGL